MRLRVANAVIGLDWARTCAVVLAVVVGGGLTCSVWGADDVQVISRDHVLGTSYDLKVHGTPAEAETCDAAVMGEVQRLAKVLWTGDPESEISRLMAAKGPFECSADLYAVLGRCDTWRVRSGGAFNAHMGEVIDLWSAAAKAGRLPDSKRLAGAVAKLRSPAWRLSYSSRKVEALRPLNLRVAGLGKGYILDKALAAGRAKAGRAKGIALNIGGDIVAWGAADTSGNRGWPVGVADPLRPADNAKPLATLRLVNRAAASSGGYARFYTIDGKRYSHILDPRTGRPAIGAAGATVVAPDAASADAAATALCVLPPSRGVEMIDRIPLTECLIVDADGKPYTSRHWKSLVTAGSAQVVKPPTGNGNGSGTTTGTDSGGAWPKGYGVNVRLSIRRNRKRPMVAAWVTDSRGKPIKMLALWGKTKYLRKLSAWYRQGSALRRTAFSIVRASRSAGVYTLAWDGTDLAGKRVGAGEYSVYIEMAREKGTHVLMTAAVTCGGKTTDTARMRGNAESDGAEVRYGAVKR